VDTPTEVSSLWRRPYREYVIWPWRCPASRRV